MIIVSHNVQYQKKKERMKEKMNSDSRIHPPPNTGEKQISRKKKTHLYF